MEEDTEKILRDIREDLAAIRETVEAMGELLDQALKSLRALRDLARKGGEPN